MQVTTLLQHQGSPTIRGGRDGVESVSLLMKGSMAKLRRGEPSLNLILLLVPLSAPNPCQEEGTQMEEGLGFHPALKLLQHVNPARAQLECELVWRYDIWHIKLARRYERQQAQMVEQADATFQEVFSRWARLTWSNHCLGVSPPRFLFTTQAMHWPPLSNRKRSFQWQSLYLN